MSEISNNSSFEYEFKSRKKSAVEAPGAPDGNRVAEPLRGSESETDEATDDRQPSEETETDETNFFELSPRMLNEDFVQKVCLQCRTWACISDLR